MPEGDKMREGKADSSQLIIFDDGTLYHIDLKRADHIPSNILLVGAADRVDTIAAHFDKTNFGHRNKSRPEFYIVAGEYRGMPVAALSIGIGVGPVDIVMNELHALFEYDHGSKIWIAERPRNINIIRMGTCGTSLPFIKAGALAVSEYALGLDNLGAYYPFGHNPQSMAAAIERAFLKTPIGVVNPLCYCSSASPLAVDAICDSTGGFGDDVFVGITTASPGFFSPEGRQIGRIKTAFGPEEFRNIVQSFEIERCRIINHEMETSLLFRIGYEQLGYNVGAICLVVDNLATNEILSAGEYRNRMNEYIRIALDSLKKLTEKQNRI